LSNQTLGLRGREVGAAIFATPVNDPEFSAEILRAGAKSFGGAAARRGSHIRSGKRYLLLSAGSGPMSEMPRKPT
jgi:hypothetical protein